MCETISTLIELFGCPFLNDKPDAGIIETKSAEIPLMSLRTHRKQYKDTETKYPRITSDPCESIAL